MIHPVHFNWVGPATTNDCCICAFRPETLRTEAEASMSGVTGRMRLANGQNHDADALLFAVMLEAPRCQLANGAARWVVNMSPRERLSCA
jgi:hypothetical protein